jgi:hypothetical protein
LLGFLRVWSKLGKPRSSTRLHKLLVVVQSAKGFDMPDPSSALWRGVAGGCVTGGGAWATEEAEPLVEAAETEVPPDLVLGRGPELVVRGGCIIGLGVLRANWDEDTHLSDGRGSSSK